MHPTWDAYVNFARKPSMFDWIMRDAASVVSYYRFRDESGTDATDAYAGIDGVYTGGYTLEATSALTYDTDEDKSVELNGSTGYVTVADDARHDVADSFTIAVSVYRDAAGVKHYVCQKGTGALGVYVGTDNKVYLEKVGTGTIIASSATVAATTWTRIVVTKDAADSARIFINGIDKSDAATYVDRTCTTTASAFVWGRSAAPGDYFDGKIDEAVIASAPWSRADVARDAVAALYGELGIAMDSIGESGHDLIRGLNEQNGRNKDLVGDQVGQLSMSCRNDTHYFNPERNLAPNPSFEAGLHDLEEGLLGVSEDDGDGWYWVADPASGTYAIYLTTAFAMAIPGTFADGETVTVRVKAKGSGNIALRLCDAGEIDDIDTGAIAMTGSFVEHDLTLTLTADRDDLYLVVSADTAATIDEIQINRGSTAYTWVEGPCWWMLQPGALVHVTADEGGVEPIFTGRIDDYDQTTRPGRVTITAQDSFGDLDTDVAITLTSKTHRDARVALINEAIRVIEGGYENKCINGDFPGGSTSGWTATAGSLSTGGAAAVGDSSLEVTGDAVAVYNTLGTTVPLRFYGGRWITLSFYAKLLGAAETLLVTFGTYGGSGVTFYTGSTRRPALSSSWQRYHISVLVDSDTTAVYASFDPTSGSGAAGVRISGVMISDGDTLRDWRAFGDPFGTRIHDWLFEVVPSPEIGVGWGTAWHNHIDNPEFVTNTTGWATSTSGFITSAGGTVTRSATTLGEFATHAIIGCGGSGYGGRYRMSGTFYSGQMYCVQWFGDINATGAITAGWGVGDSANPTDKTSVSYNDQSLADAQHALYWTPSGNRTTAEVWFRSDSGGVSFRVTGVMVSEVPSAAVRRYARVGVQTPAALTHPTSITAVADATLGQEVVEIVTRAVAGSGVFLRSELPLVDGTRSTFSITINAPGGSGSVLVGIMGAYGLVSELSAYRTVALTADYVTLAITMLADHTDLSSTGGVGVWIAAASASAVTFRVVRPQVFVGGRTQEWAHPLARGVDAADVDAHVAMTINGSALSSLRDANVSMATHWIEPRLTYPYARYMTAARQSRSTKAVDSVVTDVAELYNIRRRRSTTYQQVSVPFFGQDTDPVVASSVQAYRDRMGTVRTLPIPMSDWIYDEDTASEIAEAMLARYQTALLLPTLELVNDAAILTRQPGDRLELNVSDQLLSGLSVSVLNRSIRVSEGKGGLHTRATYDCEEWTLS